MKCITCQSTNVKHDGDTENPGFECLDCGQEWMELGAFSIPAKEASQ